jgi:hypothetical protein
LHPPGGYRERMADLFATAFSALLLPAIAVTALVIAFF